MSPAAPRHMLAATASETRTPLQMPGSVDIADAFVELLLGDEPAEQGNAGHRTGRERRADGGQRHRPTQSSERCHVARAGLVLDRSGDQEERPLVAGMGEQIGEAGGNRLWRADAEQQHQNARAR